MAGVGPEAGGSATSETEILQALHAALSTDRWTRTEHGAFSVAFEAGALRLEGRVAGIAAKRRAIALAKLLAHGLRVDDRVRRAAARRRGDGDLAHAAGERLASDRMFHRVGLVVRHGTRREVLRDVDTSYAVSVAAEDGCVTLAGSVMSPNHARLAEVMVWWIDGCELIENELKVDPPRESNDDELNDAVRMALEKDPLVDAGQLHVATAASIVQLEGLVPNETQRRRVIEDVWLVPSVWDVDDKLQTAG